ncbi:hypothetical protein JL722_2211 [Aureococcus anophagefferens]|nr:hypothetical protein JL722_2211 [Aureococcus anophagefferens]
MASMHRLHRVVLLAAVLRASCLAPVPRRAAPSRAPGAATASDDLAPASPLLAVLSVAAAAAFGLGVYAVRGPEAALEFSAGYVVEQSLSVDNLLVFLVLFDYFRVPAGPMQDKALAYGLYGAVVCRGVFAADDLAYLEKAVAVVLGFVGLKLGFGYFGFEIETGQSLAVIATVLGAGILASIYFPPDEGEES